MRYRAPMVRTTLVRSPKAAYCINPITTTEKAEAMFTHLRKATREEFWALYLSARNVPLALRQVSVGTLTGSLVHPREVFGPALALQNVAAIMVAHNHPSGTNEPSNEDIEVTQRLKKSGELLGVPLLDHLILTVDGGCYSFRQLGRL